ncbi:MAG TPA: class I SAM-dependent methyltransferase [Thermoanaerobaculia bacterium]
MRPARIKKAVGEASASEWNRLYSRRIIPWQSAGLTVTARRLLHKHAAGKRLLEVGCGVGNDAKSIADMGFSYVGIDIAESAIEEARSLHSAKGIYFACTDIFRRLPDCQFDVVYDKGLFHNLGGVRRRNVFVRRIAGVLGENGIWLTVSGSADQRREDFGHGAIYLRDLVGPAEVYFEALEVLKGPYGLVDQEHDFSAWHAVFRRR